MDNSVKIKPALALWLVLVTLCLLAQQAVASSRVFVTSEPDDASVTLDDTPVGKTPLPELLLEAGKYRLEFRLRGHQTKAYDFENHR